MIERNITNIIRDNMFDYSAYVDLDRAIPSVESGLKPSLERILWTMYEGKNFKFTKSIIPVNSLSAPIGNSIGAAFAPNLSDIVFKL